jgi:multidrug resistance efflux pump
MKHYRIKITLLGLTSWLGLWFWLGAGQSASGADPVPNQQLVIECGGVVKPQHELILRLRPGERVLDVRVGQREMVKAGSPLAEVYDGEAWTQLRELKSQERDRCELASKENRLNRLEEDLQSQLRLWKEIDPDAADRRVAELREKRDELKEQVELLKIKVPDSGGHGDTNSSASAPLAAQIHLLESQLAAQTIVAPFSGQIAYCAADPARLAAGETVLEAWDTNVVVRAEILQHQLAYVSKGCRAEVTLDFSDEKPVGATVASIEVRPEIQAGETYPTFGVGLSLDAVGHHLKAGMRVSVRIHPERPAAK